MFTEAGRAALLAGLVAHARADPAVTGAALVGSGARQALDRWSDLDLAVRLAPGADPVATADAWRAHLEDARDVVDHLDVWSGPALYRVFLLADSLQVDLSFWPADAFASNGEPFELVFGEAARPTTPGPTAPGAGEVGPGEVGGAIGWAWLHALHLRSALARGRSWQALHMLDGLRDGVIALACRRQGVPAHQGRGVDQLPAPLLARLGGTLVAAPDLEQLAAAFAQLVALLAEEVEAVDPERAGRLRPTLAVLVETA